MSPNDSHSNDRPSAVLMNPYEQILQKTHDRHIPFCAHMELTYRCNLSCVHCYATNRDGKGELALPEIEDVLDQLADMGCLFLTLTGGEILARDDFADILAAAQRRQFALQLMTNGTLMDEAMADRIANVAPLRLDFSLYAMDPAIHDGITASAGSQVRTMHAISMCRDRGLNVAIKTILMTENASEYAAIRDFAAGQDTSFVFDFVLAPADDGSRPMTSYGLAEAEIERFIKDNASPEQDPPPLPDPSQPLCGAGSNVLCISPYGDVFPCLAIRESIGNVRNKPLSDLWRASSLDNLRNAKYRSLADCNGCDVAAYCTRCSGVAHAECGDLFGRSDSACAVARATKSATDGTT